MKNLLTIAFTIIAISAGVYILNYISTRRESILISRIDKLQSFRDSCISSKHKLFKVGVHINGEWYALKKCPVWVNHYNGKSYDADNGHSLTKGEEHKMLVNTPNGDQLIDCPLEDDISYEWR